jgi:aminoglycoside phosphotransferase (APT) family kinase protein
LSGPLSLSYQGVVDYLLQRGLIATAEVVSGTLAVRNVSRRNHVFAITREPGECFLLKQGIGRDRISTIEFEALVYERLGRNSGSTDFTPYLPRSYGYDPKEHVLIVQFLRDGEDLRQYCTKRHKLPARIGAELGCALATLHRTNWSAGGRADRSLDLGAKPPWVLSQVRPDLRAFCRSSAGTIELFKVLQGFSDFRKHFDRLRGEWKAESFLHFDLRWDNCIIVPRAASNGSNGDTELRIVDWELAGRGDPRWDVGAVFANFLSFWLGGISVTGDSPPDQYLDAAEMPLERLQPAIRAFWSSYESEMGMSETASEAWLLRAVEYAAANLVQTAVEWVRELAELAGAVICLMQLSLNMLQRPKQAAAHLLGIPL